MSGHVCFIRQTGTLERGPLDELIRALQGWQSSEVLWNEWSGWRPGVREPSLLVAATEAPSERAVAFLDWFGRIAARGTRLALLHENCHEIVVESAARAADEFLLAPLRSAEIRHRLARLTQRGEDLDAIANRLIQSTATPQLVGRSPVFEAVIQSLGRVASSGLPVLITGETGTGKDMCARVLHQLSQRRGHPFITADCSAIPGHLFENEMFGHAKGAYTDASQEHSGLVGLADGGTLFLDEIDALTLETQAKLLRFLEAGTYRPLGSARARSVDVNVIAATNADLQDAVRRQQFRSDLYFRMNVLNIHLPPLRQRHGDIRLLAQNFLLTHPGGAEPRSKRFSQRALQALEAHAWPGNVRELRNVIHRAAILAESSFITAGDLSIGGPASAATIQEGTFQQKRQCVIQAYEKTVVEDALRISEGNVTYAAKALGKDRRVLGRMMKRYGIDRRSFA